MELFNKITWENNQITNGYVLVVTPFYQEVAGREVDPIAEVIWRHKDYIRTSSTIPILEGAVPDCLFEDGQAYPIGMDQAPAIKVGIGVERKRSH
ncbi:hypothetical protein SAMN05661091_4932 [Paenibacillus uliginis N3/975]|uniref:Uncharacterized protein n=1 Tax=Paenibacillus uliginis N3/975 TaxID=1313296 RepID=A0A1X7HPX8_9BACL|nr:hypothetical protein [Paenibacillus uliginis]SMF90201.1 hypothetical protein SAMN05661091_4932 [Paenibacillus uliginis N3/975]